MSRSSRSCPLCVDDRLRLRLKRCCRVTDRWLPHTPLQLPPHLAAGNRQVVGQRGLCVITLDGLKRDQVLLLHSNKSSTFNSSAHYTVSWVRPRLFRVPHITHKLKAFITTGCKYKSYFKQENKTKHFLTVKWSQNAQHLI